MWNLDVCMLLCFGMNVWLCYVFEPLMLLIVGPEAVSLDQSEFHISLFVLCRVLPEWMWMCWFSLGCICFGMISDFWYLHLTCLFLTKLRKSLLRNGNGFTKFSLNFESQRGRSLFKLGKNEFIWENATISYFYDLKRQDT